VTIVAPVGQRRLALAIPLHRQAANEVPSTSKAHLQPCNRLNACRPAAWPLLASWSESECNGIGWDATVTATTPRLVRPRALGPGSAVGSRPSSHPAATHTSPPGFAAMMLSVGNVLHFCMCAVPQVDVWWAQEVPASQPHRNLLAGGRGLVHGRIQLSDVVLRQPEDVLRSRTRMAKSRLMLTKAAKVTATGNHAVCSRICAGNDSCLAGLGKEKTEYSEATYLLQVGVVLGGPGRRVVDDGQRLHLPLRPRVPAANLIRSTSSLPDTHRHVADNDLLCSVTCML
jgi:hypothetical protein